MAFELLEIVHEHIDKFFGLCIVCGLVGPGRTRIENGSVHARHFNRNGKAEIRIGAEFRIVE
ncbi:hypothetical protein FQZ97_835000 [compost metagenome]